MLTNPLIPRRALLRQSACGFGMLSLAGLLGAESPANPLGPKTPHFTPRAKRVIFLFMHGGPSSIDTFDPKPRLIQDDGKPLPFKRPLTFAEGRIGNLMKSPWQFKRYGNPAGTSPFFTWIPVGGTANIQYSPNAACGTKPVLIQNSATAALYYYTP